MFCFRSVMDRVESERIERALDVLREAAALGGQITQRTLGVRLALWVLRRHCSDDWLKQYWDAAGSQEAIGRSQGLHAAYNGIVRQLKRGSALQR